jgi:hypothetical protein
MRSFSCTTWIFLNRTGRGLPALWLQLSINVGMAACPYLIGTWLSLISHGYGRSLRMRWSRTSMAVMRLWSMACFILRLVASFLSGSGLIGLLRSRLLASRFVAFYSNDFSHQVFVSVCIDIFSRLRLLHWGSPA